MMSGFSAYAEVSADDFSIASVEKTYVKCTMNGKGERVPNYYVVVNGVAHQTDSRTFFEIKKARNEEIDFAEDMKSAVASVKYKADQIAEADSYTLRAISPYNSSNGYNNGFVIYIPTDQTEALAQVLVAESAPQIEPTGFNIAFKHATAYAHFSFTNLNLDGATVNGVTVKSEVPFVGKFNYNYAEESAEANTATTLINLPAKTQDLWFACAPVNVSGKKLTFTISTSIR